MNEMSSRQCHTQRQPGDATLRIPMTEACRFQPPVMESDPQVFLFGNGVHTLDAGPSDSIDKVL
jgi:hypothetical protein